MEKNKLNEKENKTLVNLNLELEEKLTEAEEHIEELEDSALGYNKEIKEYRETNYKLNIQKKELIKFLQRHTDPNRPNRTLYYTFLEEQFERVQDSYLDE